MRHAMVNGPPSFEEFQRQMNEFMRQHFQGVPKTESQPATSRSPGEVSETTTSAADFKFDYRPREVKAYLDRFVIKQEEAKKVLSVALCDHYHHVHQALEGKDPPYYTKQNIILTGPTGVGKTYLIRSLADLIGVPFVKADATKFSETGYVGGDVEDLVRDLYRRANNDVARAQYGIIYIDEIDKIATANTAMGRDVSGRGVQTNLLKLMEDTDVPARAPHDIASQIQAVMEMSQTGRKQPSVINTRHILFIVSGAFDGLDKIIRKRLREATIGFAAKTTPESSDTILDKAQTRDFIEFGFEPEFIGRLPVRVVCHALNVDDLHSILKTAEGSIIRQYEQSFAAYGIEVLFQEDGLRRIAELAADEQTGARGLMTVCERVFREFKFQLPSTHVRRFVVTRDVVDHAAEELPKIMAEHEIQERVVARQLVHEFAQRFQETHGLRLCFTESAADRLVVLALAESSSVREFCARRFKDYQFGLRLIAQNTGQTEFELDVAAVEAPDKFISDRVVASYRAPSPGSEGSPGMSTPPDPSTTQQS